MIPIELRRQVLRRLRYATNVLAVQQDLIPAEGPLDVALSNGLAAIVAMEQPDAVYDKRGRVQFARELLPVAAAAFPVDMARLTEVLDLAGPARHGSADDEWLRLGRAHLEAVQALDQHPALRVLSLAKVDRRVETLLVHLYGQAAQDASGASFLDPKERSLVLDTEVCDTCGRMCFVPERNDDWGGTAGPGQCYACGEFRDQEQADQLATEQAYERYMEAD